MAGIHVSLDNSGFAYSTSRDIWSFEVSAKCGTNSRRRLLLSLRLTFVAAFALAALAGQAAVATPAPVMDKIPLHVVTTIGCPPEESRVLRVSIALEYASRDLWQRVRFHKAKIQHHVILELSEVSANQWNSEDVKFSLQDRLVENLNLVFDLDPEKGIQDVFFPEFEFANSAI